MKMLASYAAKVSRKIGFIRTKTAYIISLYCESGEIGIHASLRN